MFRSSWLFVTLALAGPASAGPNYEMDMAYALVRSPLTADALRELDDQDLYALGRQVNELAREESEGERSPKAHAARIELMDALRERDPDYREEIGDLERSLLSFAQLDGGRLLQWYVSGRPRGAILLFERQTLKRGQPADAVAAARVAVDAWRRGQLPHREAMARLAWAARLADDHELWMDLAEMLYSDDDPNAVLAAASKARQLARTDRERADALYEIGAARQQLDEPRGAVAAFEERAELLERLGEAHPDDADLAMARIVTDYRIARLHRFSLSVTDGIAPAERSHRMAEALGARFPDEASWRRREAYALWLLADTREAMGALPAAREHLDAELAIWSQLVEDGSTREADRREVADTQWNLGRLAAREGRFDDAMQRYSASVELLEDLAERDDSDQTRVRALRQAQIGELEATLGRLEKGARRFRDAYSTLRTLALENPDRPSWTWDLVWFARELADVERRVGREQSADELVETADRIERGKSAHKAEVDVPADSARWDHANLLVLRARVAATERKWEEALSLRERAHEVFVRVQPGDPDNRDLDATTLANRAEIAEIHRAQGDLPVAAQVAEEVRAGWAELCRTAPSDVDWRESLAEAWHRIGGIRAEQGQIASANAAFGESYLVWQALLERDDRVVKWQEGLSAASAARQY